MCFEITWLGYFCPNTNASQRIPEVVVVVKVAKPYWFIILGGILWQGCGCVKGFCMSNYEEQYNSCYQYITVLISVKGRIDRIINTFSV